ncbi:MAG: hypothetical protein K8F30_05690 [Taibaiella sp.]|nr:hypothetical protein [Taibaiella sp.]
MKVHWLKKFLISVLIISGTFAGREGYAQSSAKTLTRKEALTIAESTAEAEKFYTMYEGRLKNCIEKEVVKPCESDWVSCIENAWVVQFTIGDICKIEQDGRLGLTILVDALTGQILSRFPEVAYFNEESYCLDDSDCICGREGEGPRLCYNFVAAQVLGVADFQCRQCGCVQNQCVLKKN